MRVSLQWLRDYIDLPTTEVDELTRAFDYLGHAVESVEEITADWTDVVVGKVERIEAHPDADKVRVTHVDLGDGELHQIICGAWNFAEGAIVPVAVPGSVLAGGFEIGRRNIRGVESHGMICSERELGLGELHEGIMVLDPGTPLGLPFAGVARLPDIVFDLEVTNNRPDVMGMVGVARELAAWFGIDYRIPPVGVGPTADDPASISISISAPDGCNRFVAREIRGVTIGESPLWLRERLRRSGVRAISNVVDVTNYVMLELGHPLHAFDAERIAGGRLDVRWAAAGEVLTTLDGSERALTPEDLVIVDDEGPTSLAAVMGGARSEVAADTSHVLMEAASWHPATVMHTSRRHDLRSEASARFERGVDPNLAPLANARACDLLVEISGGTIGAETVDVIANSFEPLVVTLEASEVRRILDERFTAERSSELLGRLGLDVHTTGDVLTVTVPTNRPDLTRPADLIEEIARLSDYDTFGETLPTGQAGGLTDGQRRTRRVHEALRGMGLFQAMNLPFVSQEELDAFTEGGADRVVTVRNPLREDQGKLRQRLLPALLRNVRDNLNRGAGSVALFESGRVFYSEPWSEDSRVPAQPERLAVVVAGPFGARSFEQDAQPANGATALAVVQAISRVVGRPLQRVPEAHPGLHPGRSATVMVDGKAVGIAGELHPAAAAQFDIDTRVGVLEIDLEPVIAPAPPAQMQPVPTYPHVDFDLSFDVPPGVLARDLLEATTAAGTLVESANLFDEYRPEASARRSLAVRYRLRAEDRTLDSDEIAGERERMIAAAAGLGASLRGAGGEEDS